MMMMLKKQLLFLQVKNGTKKVYVAVDLFIADPADKPFAMIHYTGNKIFNIKMRMHAKMNGKKLNQYGIFDGNKRSYKSLRIKTEKNLFDYMDIPIYKPKDRTL